MSVWSYFKTYGITNRRRNKTNQVTSRKKKFDNTHRKKLVISYKANLCSLNPDQRFLQLRYLANKLGQKVTRRSIKDNRISFDLTKWRLYKQWPNCFVCKAKTEHIHHIQQIQNGGLNKRSNLVGLCKQCHTNIHAGW